jgi:glycerol kinase
MSTLAIDQGTTSTRALLVEPDGKARVLHSVAHRQIYPEPSLVEHDPEELIRNIRHCLTAAGTVDDVQAVGIDNQGESCLAWDAETGEAVGNVIVWQDGRTSAVTEGLRRDGSEAMVLDRAGLPLDPYFSASKLGWILQHNEEAQRLAKRGRLRLGTTDAFFRDRLTGRFQTDISTASRTSLMNIATGDWDEEMCRLFGVPIEFLPPILPTTGDLGALDCGGAKLPLTASIVDQQASLYGHGCRVAGDVKITFGTGAFALQVSGALTRTAVSGPLPTVAWQKFGESVTYALDGGVYCASSAINWARQLGLFDDYAEIDAFHAPPAIDRGLVFVPALTGLACPHWDRSARGAWLGLSLDSSKRDMMQAVLEGIALRMGEVMAAMNRQAPTASIISIDGGLTANSYFCQFLADTLEAKIIVSDQPECTAVGTAALAAEAIGRPFALRRSGRQVVPGLHDPKRLKIYDTAVSIVRSFGKERCNSTFHPYRGVLSGGL